MATLCTSSLMYRHGIYCTPRTVWLWSLRWAHWASDKWIISEPLSEVFMVKACRQRWARRPEIGMPSTHETDWRRSPQKKGMDDRSPMYEVWQGDTKYHCLRWWPNCFKVVEKLYTWNKIVFDFFVLGKGSLGMYPCSIYFDQLR